MLSTLEQNRHVESGKRLIFFVWDRQKYRRLEIYIKVSGIACFKKLMQTIEDLASFHQILLEIKEEWCLCKEDVLIYVK